MSDVMVGKIIESPENVSRDAIHIAIIPCQAGYFVGSGDYVRLAYGTSNIILPCGRDDNNCIGVVDPYLDAYVNEGQWCYVFLLPGTVTGMRHHWHHPIFDNKPKITNNESELWLRKFSDKWRFNYRAIAEMLKTLKRRRFTVIVPKVYFPREFYPPPDQFTLGAFSFTQLAVNRVEAAQKVWEEYGVELLNKMLPSIRRVSLYSGIAGKAGKVPSRLDPVLVYEANKQEE